jgi:hypothetical protein
MNIIEWKSGEFEVTTDCDRMDIQTMHNFLALESKWARGIAREIVERSIQHSLRFGHVPSEQASRICTRDHRLCDDRISWRLLCPERLSRRRAGQVVDGMRRCASRPSGPPALNFGHGRCTRLVSEMSVYAVRAATGAVHGAS